MAAWATVRTVKLCTPYEPFHVRLRMKLFLTATAVRLKPRIRTQGILSLWGGRAPVPARADSGLDGAASRRSSSLAAQTNTSQTKGLPNRQNSINFSAHGRLKSRVATIPESEESATNSIVANAARVRPLAWREPENSGRMHRLKQSEVPHTNKWIVALTVILPTFLEVMDTSVVNVSLPHIQGSLSAGADEVTWVLTSYLVANAVVIPITGWLASIFGRKRYLIFSIVLFTLSSIACGAAPSLHVLVLARILQGLGGGGLQPLSQAILLEAFPVAEHGIAMAVFGAGVVFAPILGPVVGGWITDNWAWRWVFYINLPFGILAVVLAAFLIHDPEYIRKAKRTIDYWGLSLIALGLGCLQIVLDKGEREDWFSSRLIVALSVIAVASLVIFVIVELRQKHPVVNLRAFRDRTFASGNTMMFLGFFCVFGGFYLLPLYAQTLMGYTAMWAGFVLGPGGLSSLLVMPFCGGLMKKGVSPRFLLALGLATLAYSLWLMSGFNLQADFKSLVWPRIVQGVGLGLFFVPLAASTYVNIPKEEMGNASGIFNLLRNLGGSFGVAVSSTLLSQRSQFHQTFLVERITPSSPTLHDYIQQLTHALGGSPSSGAHLKLAMAGIYREVQRQAAMLAFNDIFWFFALLTAVLVPLTLLMEKPRIPGSADMPVTPH